MKINFSIDFKPKLRNKLLLSIGGLIVVLFSVVLLFISSEIETHTRSIINSNFEKTISIFKRIQQYRFDRLLESCILISEQPQFKANVDLARMELNEEIHRTVLFNASEFKQLVITDLIIITNSKGKLIVRTDSPGKFGDDLSELNFIKSALLGNDPDKVSIYVEEENIYQVVSVPILLNNEVLGTLTLGFKIKKEDADQLKQDTKTEISFFLGHKLLTTTLDEESAVDLTKATFTFANFMMNENNKNIQENAFEYKLKDERYLIIFSGLEEDNSNAMYAIAISLDIALKPLILMQRFILVIGLSAMIVTILIIYFIAKGVTAPVNKLVEGAHRIGSGDFEFSIPITSKDEIGTLAKAFNEMTSGLRERYHIEKYVSSSTLNMIKKADKEGVKLGGERKNVTVFFSDIRGFTSFSEKVDPEEVIGMLNLYLRKQAKLVLKHDGAIDKYVGDELVAVFEGENMVDNAVLCAIEIQKEIAELNEELNRNIKIGIGINTGMVIMGNMGSEERMDYTVLGSNVNLGARLCSSANPGQIVLSESSYRLLKIKVKVNPLEPLQAKGISKPIQVYEILI